MQPCILKRPDAIRHVAPHFGDLPHLKSTTSTSALAFGVASECVTLAASADGTPLEWVKLLPMGRFGGVDGRGGYLVENIAHAEQIIAASKPRADSRDPVVDYDHQTDLAAIPGVGGTAPASGWIVEMAAREDGIYGRIDWTGAAQEKLAAKEYRYISPVFPHSKSTGRVNAILRAGLTNKPNLELGALASETEHPNGDTVLDKSKLALSLGLAADASEEEINAAIAALKTSGEAAAADLATVAQAAGLAATAPAGDIVTAVQAAQSGGGKDEAVVALQSELNTLKASIAQDKAVEAVDAAIEAGKITPAARDTFISLHASNPAQFDAVVGAMPVVLKPGPKPGAPVIPTGDGALTDQEKAVCAAMGWSEADFQEFEEGPDLTWR